MPADIDRSLAIVCFGLACTVGLAGAFMGLDTHGFWFDELFTARILDSAPGQGAGLMSRIATDVHPPVYLVALTLYSTIFGSGDVALRSFSALSACAAIVIFIAGTRAAFSLPGRLFGAAMATGSLFWFFQAQNARSYGFCLMIGAAILALCLSLLDERPRRASNFRLASLIALAILGSFAHFYLMYVSVAALMMVALLQPRHRIIALAAAAGLLLVTGLYVKLVVTPFSQVALGNNWYPNTLDWYLRVLRSCVQFTFGDAGLVALLLCLGAALYSRRFPGGAASQSRFSAGFPPRLPGDPATILLLGVPLLVLAAGIVSSTLLAPNFYDRNLLIASPFLWGLSARLYDAATATAPRLVRIAVTAALGVITLSMAAIVGLRFATEDSPPLYEPFRQSAEWIRTLPQCRDQLVPVLSPDNPRWYKPGYAESIYVSGYGRYLNGYARPQLIFMADVTAHRLPDDVKAELQQRLRGEGCPVLAWSAHNMDDDPHGTARGQLLASLDYSAAGPAVTTRQFRDGSGGFVLYVTGARP